MDDTQNYLNSILKKRLGSVVNYNGSSKTAVTRIPKQQQKVQHMPTVFRKKHQSQQQTTGYMLRQQQNSCQFNKGSNGSYYSQLQQQQLAQSQYLSNHGSINNIKNSNNNQQLNKQFQNQQPTQQRVQYMLISKRIQSLKEQQQDQSYQFKIRTKTVDVTNYNSKNINNQNNSDKNNKNKKTTIIKSNSNRQQSLLESMQQEYYQNHSNTSNNNNNDLTSNHRQQKYNNNSNDNINDNNTAINVSKRKRIFNKYSIS